MAYLPHYKPTATKTISNANPLIMVCLRVGLGAVCCIQPNLHPSQKIKRKVYSISRARASIIRNNRSAMSVSFFQAAVTRCRGSLKYLRGGFKLVVRRLAAYRLPAGLIFVLDFQAASAVCGRQPETEMEWRVG